MKHSCQDMSWPKGKYHIILLCRQTIDAVCILLLFFKDLAAFDNHESFYNLPNVENNFDNSTVILRPYKSYTQHMRVLCCSY